MKKKCIITAADARVGAFLVRHWYVSLFSTTDMHDIDVVVLDYGLQSWVRQFFEKNNVKCIPCKKDGHVTALRFRDAYQFLTKNVYDQVLLIDGGDVIFQADIHSMFLNIAHTISVFVETYPVIVWSETAASFLSIPLEELKKTITSHASINAGVIVGSYDRMFSFCKDVASIMKRFDLYGVDQAAAIYILYRDGFTPLPEQYNFLPTTARKSILIKDGVFLDPNDNHVIPIVHNGGGVDMFRPIYHFGYGSDCNIIAPAPYFLGRILGKFFYSIRLNSIKR